MLQKCEKIHEKPSDNDISRLLIILGDLKQSETILISAKRFAKRNMKTHAIIVNQTADSQIDKAIFHMVQEAIIGKEDKDFNMVP